MQQNKVTATEVTEAIRKGQIVGFYPRKRRIALDGSPARPATPQAIDAATKLLIERRFGQA